MCEYLNDYLARILPLFALAVSLILGAICSLCNGHRAIQAQPLSQASSVTQTPPFVSRSFQPDNESPHWPHTRAYLTDFPPSEQYGMRTKQPVTSSFETQPPKQVRFASQDAVNMRQAPPAAGGGREQTNKYHYQLPGQQLNQESLSRHFLPESSLINTRHPPNMIGKIQSKQPANNPSNQVPISSYSSSLSAYSWSPTLTYGQQQTLAAAIPIARLNPAGRIATKLVPDDTIQARVDDFQVYKSYPAQTRTNKDGCFGKSVGRLYSGARNLVTGALKQYATPGSLMLGSSLLAAAIPLSSWLALPAGESRGRRDSKDEPGNSHGDNHDRPPATLPVTQTVQGRVESVMGWIERSVEHLPNFPRLHPQECVKRSICEAHNEPNKYGAIGFVLRLFFPATNLSITDRMDDMEYKVINKYRYAAGFGLNKRIDNNGSSSAACKEKYEDCLVSLLDVAQNLIDIFLK